MWIKYGALKQLLCAARRPDLPAVHPLYDALLFRLQNFSTITSPEQQFTSKEEPSELPEKGGCSHRFSPSPPWARAA